MLRGLKPAMIGIILATGIYMACRNGLILQAGPPQLRPLLLTVLLGGIYFGARHFRRGGISPIQLICLSAACGLLIYSL